MCGYFRDYRHESLKFSTVNRAVLNFFTILQRWINVGGRVLFNDVREL
jgi:hypothetical protein